LKHQIYSRITGTGAAVPNKILTNFDLAEMVDTSDEWIRTRTGIQRRHIAEDGIATSDLATQAGLQALEEASVDPKDLDLIIVGTVTPDMYFPSAACFVQEKLEAINAAAFDVSAACSGFLYGLSIADSYVASGRYKNILVIGAELLSRITDWTDRSTCVLFGDGAGAVVVQPAVDDRGIISTYIKSDGRLTQLLKMPGGGSILPPAKSAENPKAYYIQMEGREVFRYAVNAMGDAASRILEQNGFSGEDVALFIPHQANIRIIQAIAKKLDVPDEKVYVNVDEYGNTSAASIPIALDESRRKGLVKDGDLVLMVAFGGGFTWASALVRL